MKTYKFINSRLHYRLNICLIQISKQNRTKKGVLTRLARYEISYHKNAFQYDAYHPPVAIWGGVSVWGSPPRGGPAHEAPAQGDSCSVGSLSREGVSLQGAYLCPKGCLCPEGFLSRDVSVQGGLCPEGLLPGGLCMRDLPDREPPRWRPPWTETKTHLWTDRHL